jgi:hypothetical protein
MFLLHVYAATQGYLYIVFKPGAVLAAVHLMVFSNSKCFKFRTTAAVWPENNAHEEISLLISQTFYKYGTTLKLCRKNVRTSYEEATQPRGLHGGQQ